MISEKHRMRNGNDCNLVVNSSCGRRAAVATQQDTVKRQYLINKMQVISHLVLSGSKHPKNKQTKLVEAESRNSSNKEKSHVHLDLAEFQ